MKKFIACLVALMLCVSMVLPVMAAEAEFTPSVTNKPAPEIVPVIDPDGNPAIGVICDGDGKIIDYVYDDCIVITPVSEAKTSERIPDDAEELLLDVYAKLQSGDMVLPYEKYNADLNASNMVIRDLFDVTFLCEEHPEMLEAPGVTLKLNFDLGIAADKEVVTMCYVDGEWNPIVSTVNNGDGTVTCIFEKVCPVSFSVRTAVKPPVQTGDQGSMGLWVLLAGVALCAIAVLTVVYIKDTKKAA